MLHWNIPWQVKENYTEARKSKKQYSIVREKEDDLCTNVKAKVEFGEFAISF